MTDYMTIRQALDWLAEHGQPYGDKTIRVAIRKGKLHAARFGHMHRLSEADLRTWLSNKGKRRGAKPKQNPPI